MTLNVFCSGVSTQPRSSDQIASALSGDYKRAFNNHLKTLSLNLVGLNLEKLGSVLEESEWSGRYKVKQSWGVGGLLEEKHAYVQSMLMYLSINVVETPELLVITKAYN